MYGLFIFKYHSRVHVNKVKIYDNVQSMEESRGRLLLTKFYILVVILFHSSFVFIQRKLSISCYDLIQYFPSVHAIRVENDVNGFERN